MAVQWLGFRAFTAIGLGSIPGCRTKTPQAMYCGRKERKQLAGGGGGENFQIKWMAQILPSHICMLHVQSPSFFQMLFQAMASGGTAVRLLFGPVPLLALGVPGYTGFLLLRSKLWLIKHPV